MLDPFLADVRLAPIIETNRGCPYSCAYCCWGQATQSKINQFPLDTVIAEIKHAAHATNNPTGFFYVADGNFGIFERDQEIAQAFQEPHRHARHPQARLRLLRQEHQRPGDPHRRNAQQRLD